MPPLSHPFRRLDAIERRYDGPIPPAAPAVAAARARLFERLADDDRGAMALRRQRLTVADAVRDRRLAELSRSLAFHRAHGVAWRV